MPTTGDTRTIKSPHNLILERRKKLSISGVSDVDSFDDQTVVVYTELGELCIRGAGLHIGKLSIETGELSVEGEVASMVYTDQQKNSGGFFSKLFK